MESSPQGVTTAKRRAGRPSTLTRDAVLDQAVKLLDLEGLSAFSLRKLGQALAVDPMAIYHYFPNKSALLDGLVERLFSEAAVAPATGEWQQDARAIAVALRSVLLAHPNAVPLMAMRPAVTDEAFALTEALLDRLQPSGLSPAAALDVAHLLGRVVVGHAVAQAGAPPGSDGDGREEAHATALQGLPAERFPRLAAAGAAGHVIDHEALFAAAVDDTLAGVERRLVSS